MTAAVPGLPGMPPECGPAQEPTVPVNPWEASGWRMRENGDGWARDGGWFVMYATGVREGWFLFHADDRLYRLGHWLDTDEDRAAGMAHALIWHHGRVRAEGPSWVVGWPYRPLCRHCGAGWNTIPQAAIDARPEFFDGFRGGDPACCDEARAEHRGEVRR